MTRRPWTDEELGVVGDLTLSHKEAAERLGRTVPSVKMKRRSVARGWTPQIDPWTEEEEFFLLQTRHMSAPEVASLMPGRTFHQITYRREVLTAVKGIEFGISVSPFHIGSRPLLAKTCEECGNLLQANWFAYNRGPGLYWPKLCIRCGNKSTRGSNRGVPNATNDKNQRITVPHARKRRDEWVAADDDLLADPDITLVEKALRLGRTYYGVKARCLQHGYKSKVGLGDPERDVWIIDNPNEQKAS